MQRYRQAPAIKTYDLALAGIAKMIEIAAVLKRMNAEHVPAPARSNAAKSRHLPLVREPHRAGDFGNLIDAIEARHPL